MVKPPPSQMIRVPTALIPVVRQLSQLHRQGHTISLLQALTELISKFDSGIEVNVDHTSLSVFRLEEQITELQSHLTAQGLGVETKLQAMAQQLDKLERVIASGRINPKGRRQVYAHQQPQVELQPRTNISLAQRLGISSQTLINERERKSTQEFISYTRYRDPMSMGWRFSPEDGLYYPLVDTP
jgi:hypothetical protein